MCRSIEKRWRKESKESILVSAFDLNSQKSKEQLVLMSAMLSLSAESFQFYCRLDPCPLGLCSPPSDALPLQGQRWWQQLAILDGDEFVHGAAMLQHSRSTVQLAALLWGLLWAEYIVNIMATVGFKLLLKGGHESIGSRSTHWGHCSWLEEMLPL